jgi:hypothetical protein
MKALTLEPVAVELSSESFLRLLDGPMMVAWALATGVLALFFRLSFPSHPHSPDPMAEG